MTLEEFSNWYEELPILVYGELAEEDLLDSFAIILAWKRDGIFISENIPENLFTVTEYWLMLGLLTDCIDYGTSPRGAWLTPFGEELLVFLLSGKHLEYLED